jgi:hypothetical protein
MNAAFSFAVRIGSMKQPIDNEAHPEADLLPGKKALRTFAKPAFAMASMSAVTMAFSVFGIVVCNLAIKLSFWRTRGKAMRLY